MIKLDMQIHSYYSFDSLSSPEAIADSVARKGLDGFSITDHNVLRVDFNALKLKFPNLIIIPGMEIWTEFGDILLYFIKDEIKSNKAEDVIDSAHEQGGIAILAHPYHRKHYDYPESLLEKLDGIETRNSHNIENSVPADSLAKKCGKCSTGGSDAHFIFEIGNAYTAIDIDKSNSLNFEDLKKSFLKTAKPDYLKKSFHSTFYASQLIKYSKRFGFFKRLT